MYRLIISRVVLLLTVWCFVSCSKENEPTSPKARGTGARLADFPGEGRVGAIAFSLSGKGYFGLGSNMSGYLNDFWMYDPVTDSWEQMQDVPSDLPVEAAVTINNKAYVVTYSGILYEYNPLVDKWNPVSDFPPGNRPGLAGFSIGGNAYFGCGNNIDIENFSVFKDFWRYNPSSNEWTQVADLPGMPRTQAVSFVVGDKAFVGLGYDGQVGPPIYTDVWQFDPTKNLWSQIASFPKSKALVGIQFANQSNAFIGVPEETNRHWGQMFEYSVVTNEWRKISVFPSGSSLETSSFTINDRLFVIGGWWSEHTREVWEFVP